MDITVESKVKMPVLRSCPDSVATFLLRPNHKGQVLLRYRSYREELLRQAAAKQLHPHSIEMLQTFPDWLGQAGAGMLNAPQAVEAARSSPGLALELLKLDYAKYAPDYEKVLSGNGEQVRSLLQHFARNKIRALQPEEFYRSALVEDCYWGLTVAREVGNMSLSEEVERWSLAHKDEKASAAWYYLTITPQEPCYHYAKVLRTSRLYYWLACAQFPDRMKPTLNDVQTAVGDSPRWAAHFAWSGFFPEAMEKVLVKNWAWYAQFLIETGAVWNPQTWHQRLYEPMRAAFNATASPKWFIANEISNLTVRLYRLFDSEVGKRSAA